MASLLRSKLTGATHQIRGFSSAYIRSCLYLIVQCCSPQVGLLHANSRSLQDYLPTRPILLGREHYQQLDQLTHMVCEVFRYWPVGSFRN